METKVENLKRLNSKTLIKRMEEFNEAEKSVANDILKSRGKEYLSKWIEENL